MCVIFWDFDGTLVHTNSLWSNSLYKALLEVEDNTDIKIESIRKHMSYGFTWHTPEKDYSNITNEKWWEFMNQHFYRSYISCGVSKEKASAAVQQVRNIIKRAENYKIYEDAVLALKKSTELGCRNVILSNNYPDLEEVLVELGLMEYLDGIVISAVEGYDKPRRELFEIAKNKFPSKVYYMVGDSVNADIIGGKNAGMKTVLVHKKYSKLADYCVDNLYSFVVTLT